MGVKLAGWLVVAGVVVVSLGVGLYDFRAGLVVFGIAATGVGIWRLTQE